MFPVADAPSAWSPLRIPVFRALFVAMIVSNIGMWMQMVGAQWLLIDEPDATHLIALIQTAMTLPFAVFALPAGIVADNVDRRRMMLVVQALQLVVGTVLAVLVLIGGLHPYVLLFLIFLLGTGTAVSLIPFQSSVVELVPREQVPLAAVMSGLSANIARAIGPALAGVLVAEYGIPLVFAINAATIAFYVFTLARWKHDPKKRTAPREQFRPALIAGTRYVWHSPHIRKLLLRTILFTIPAQAIWALLPLVARRQLGLDVGAYGILLAALGIGAIVAAASLPRLRAVWQTNGVVGMAMVAYALATVALSFTTSVWQAVPLLTIAGFGWIGTLSTIGGSLQLYLPSWVRSRGVAINTVVLFGGQAVGAALWGYFATIMTLQQSYWLAGGVIALASTVTRIRPLTRVEDLDRTHADYWPEPHAQLSDEELEGTVLVSVEYEIEPAKLQDFVDAMAYVRVVRIRTGGMQWMLNRDVEHPYRFVETYMAGSWEEHMRQHHTRLTESDRQHEARANACAVRPPKVEHFIQTATRRR